MSIADKLNDLAETFAADIQAAKSVVSPNPEDDLCIKAAIVGFCYEASVTEWDLGHFEYVRDYLQSEYSDSAVAELGPNGINARYYCAICLGWLLGALNCHSISEEKFRQLVFTLPGFVMFNLGKITSVEVVDT